MRYRLVYSLVLAALAAGCGGEPPRTRQPAIEGITLADLRSTIEEPPKPVMLFMITYYLVDEDHLETIRICYENLSQETITFRDRKAFEANGFFAAVGTGMMAGPVHECLMRTGARQMGYTNLVLDADAELQFSELFIEDAAVASLSAEGDTQTVTLRNGVLGWALAAQPDPAFRQRVRARILPVFAPQAMMHWPGAERFAQKMSHRFDAARFDVSLREADFVILAISRDTPEEMTSLEQLLFLHPDRQNSVRIYTIMCVKADGE